MPDKDIILLGGGGHAKVLVYTLQLSGYQLLGYTDPVDAGPLFGVPRLGGDEVLRDYDPDSVLLVNGLGSTGQAAARVRLFTAFKEQGYTFLTVIHPSAVIAPDVTFGEGAQVLAGAVIMPGSVIGPNVIVNTRASVDHDCEVGAHTHIAPGVTLSGGVRIGAEVHIGTGASIVHGVAIGDQAVVGAGAVVVRDVAAGITVAGVPARPIGDLAQSSPS